VDVKQVGKDLGVRYVLEGSEQRSGNQVRVHAQLIDAETGAHLWADQFDADGSALPSLYGFMRRQECLAARRG
jgi:adenylate cyclase